MPLLSAKCGQFIPATAAVVLALHSWEVANVLRLQAGFTGRLTETVSFFLHFWSFELSELSIEKIYLGKSFMLQMKQLFGHISFLLYWNLCKKYLMTRIADIGKYIWQNMFYQ